MTKPGRPRRFGFGTDLVGFLEEVGERTEDQISHLPPEALNYTAPNSVLSVGRLVLHLVATDAKLFPLLVPQSPWVPYADQLEPGVLAETTAPPGDLSRAPEVLRDHLSFRALYWLNACRAPGFADGPVVHPACATAGELLSHLVWHWTYHSGQIGLLTLEAGYDYLWTSRPRA